ncbi:MAG TPA: hypothetical protein VLC09_15035, partial [Polyangiaceae bacterium]|nr:hypothetical protein [Polyangiaceae bacterium]
GPRNTTEVELRVATPAGVVPKVAFEESVEKALLGALPAEDRSELERGGTIRRERVWLWSPVANEQLHLIAWCGRGQLPPRGPRCGLFVARIAPGEIKALAWVPSGAWVANLYKPGPTSMLWVVGGDVRGAFKRLISYRHGEVVMGEVSRGTPPKNLDDQKKRK